MVDLMTLQCAISGLKAASDIAKGFMQLSTMAEVQTQVIELQSTILAAQSSALTAQSEQSTMIQEISDLKKEIAHLKAWEETKQRYQLISPWPGCFVFALKDSREKAEPPHWICTQCYQDRRKSILQNAERNDRRRIDTIKCSHCKQEMDAQGEAERQYVSE